MTKILLKSVFYIVLIILVLELLIRFFHLTKDYPTRYVDKFDVEKWAPNQEGYSVTGLRRQNFSKFKINSSGYNSYREFNPTKNNIEIALVGDSFIEGFHQDYQKSIGKKIENKLDNIEVYEYGYAGYDLADQLHLINKYKKQFDLINHVFIGLKFEDDLKRGKYTVLKERMVFEAPKYKILRKFKLLIYLQKIGAFDAPKKIISKLVSGKNIPAKKLSKAEEKIKKQNLETKYFKNFKSLINLYGFDKSRFVFMLEKELTPDFFLNYLDNNNFKYIDFHKPLKDSKEPTTLIYDMHWNNHGRNIISELVINYIRNNEKQ